MCRRPYSRNSVLFLPPPLPPFYPNSTPTLPPPTLQSSGEGNDAPNADAAKAPVAILGFNSRADKQSEAAARAAGVEVRTFNVVYDLVDHVKEMIEERLPAVREERTDGRAEVLQCFLLNAGKEKKMAAGCKVGLGRVGSGRGKRRARKICKTPPHRKK